MVVGDWQTRAVTTTDAPGAPVAHGRLGVATASALYIAAVLGTGILTLPGLAVDAAGPASVLAVAAVFVLSIPLAGTFAALAARYPDAGGVATFVRRALGPTAARASGYWFLFGVGFGSPVVALLGGGYVASALGLGGSSVTILALAFLLAPIGMNFVGLRLSASVQLVLSALLVLLVLGVLVVCAPHVEPGSFEPFLPHGWGGVGLAVSLFVWAFAGFEAVTHLAGEFRDPRRTIPIATAIAVVVVGAAYLTLQVVTVGVLGSGESGPLPLLDLVAIGAPGWGEAVVASIAAVMAIGVLNAYVPAFAKLAAALGRDGDLPRGLGRGAEVGEVPRRAVALVAACALGYFTVFVLAGLRLEDFILLHTSSMVAVYLLGSIAAVRLLDRWGVGWWMAVVSSVLCVGLVVLAGPRLVLPLLLALVAVAVTAYRRFRHART